jgi:hypothetical protein
MLAATKNINCSTCITNIEDLSRNEFPDFNDPGDGNLTWPVDRKAESGVGKAEEDNRLNPLSAFDPNDRR